MQLSTTLIIRASNQTSNLLTVDTNRDTAVGLDLLIG